MILYSMATVCWPYEVYIVRAESNELYLFSFSLSFLFPSIFFLLFSILELRVRVIHNVTVMLSYISYSYMSYVTMEEHKRFQKDDIIQHV